MKKTIWRVPAVLALSGILCRVLNYVIAMVYGRIQVSRGPDPVTGVYEITTGHVTEIAAVLSFLIFWVAGWRFIRGMKRKEVFLSATVMVVWGIGLLAWEQLAQAMGGFSLWCYRLQATTDAMTWVTQILIRAVGTVSIPVVVPGLFAPYLYLVFGER